MLVFEKVVKATDAEVAIYVFVDKEKGHTLYASHNGSLSLVEDAGFIGNNNATCTD